jgi:tetratricopeptide (TPR) repeat protein
MEKRYLKNLVIVLFFTLIAGVSISCNRIESHVKKGTTNLELGDFKRARTHFEAVLELQPSNFDSRLGLAKALLQEYSTHPNDTTLILDCLTQLEAARTLRPEKEVEKLLSVVWFKRANILLTCHDTVAAMAALSRSTGFDPGAMNPVNLAGILYFNRGDHGKALNLFRMVISIDSTSVQGYFNTGMVYWAESNFSSAYDYWYKAVLRSPEDKDVLTWAAMAKKQIENTNDAENFTSKKNEKIALQQESEKKHP